MAKHTNPTEAGRRAAVRKLFPKSVVAAIDHAKSGPQHRGLDAAVDLYEEEVDAQAVSRAAAAARRSAR